MRLVRENFPRVKIVFEKKQGIASARDAGFRVARGDIIARTDADSLATHHWLLAIEAFTTNTVVDGVVGTNLFREFPGRLLDFLVRRFLFLCAAYFIKTSSSWSKYGCFKSAWRKFRPALQTIFMKTLICLYTCLLLE